MRPELLAPALGEADADPPDAAWATAGRSWSVRGVGRAVGVAGNAASRWVSRSSSAVDAFDNAVCAVLTAVCASSTALIAVWHAVRSSSAGGVVDGVRRVAVVDVASDGASRSASTAGHVGADGDRGVQRVGRGGERGVDVVLRVEDRLLSRRQVRVARTRRGRGEDDPRMCRRSTAPTAASRRCRPTRSRRRPDDDGNDVAWPESALVNASCACASAACLLCSVWVRSCVSSDASVCPAVDGVADGDRHRRDGAAHRERHRRLRDRFDGGDAVLQRVDVARGDGRDAEVVALAERLRRRPPPSPAPRRRSAQPRPATCSVATTESTDAGVNGSGKGWRRRHTVTRSSGRRSARDEPLATRDTRRT